MLTMIDEYTRESLAIRVARRLNSYDVIDTLAEAMVASGVPEHVRSDNGPEFVAKRVRKWLAGLGTKPLFIEPGSPWENGYGESFNSKLRDEFLNGEIFYSLNGLVQKIGQSRSDQLSFFECVAEVAMVAALHDGLCALELYVTFADFVSDRAIKRAK